MLFWTAAFVLGLILGGVFVWIFITKRDFVGTLFFYDAEPGESPIMLSELNEPPENIGKRKYVIFRVSHK